MLFVTHEINPILPLVDRVLYLVDGRFRIGPPAEVMTSDVLSELYRTDVDVLRVRGRLVVVGAGGRGRGALPRGGRAVSKVVSFDGVGELLALPFVQTALVACAVLGLVAGLLAPLIVARGMAFAVHGTPSWRSPAGRRRCCWGSGFSWARWRAPWWPDWCSACSGCASASATR